MNPEVFSTQHLGTLPKNNSSQSQKSVKKKAADHISA